MTEINELVCNRHIVRRVSRFIGLESKVRHLDRRDRMTADDPFAFFVGRSPVDDTVSRNTRRASAKNVYTVVVIDC